MTTAVLACVCGTPSVAPASFAWCSPLQKKMALLAFGVSTHTEEDLHAAASLDPDPANLTLEPNGTDSVAILGGDFRAGAPAII